MDGVNSYEKPPPTAPPPYSALNPADVHVPNQTYGFQPPSVQPQYTPSPYMQPSYPQQQPYPVQPSYPVQQPAAPQINQTVVVIGGCPVCRVGTMEKDYTCLGILCAIFCFPVGILCCLCMSQKKCTNCGATI